MLVLANHVSKTGWQPAIAFGVNARLSVALRMGTMTFSNPIFNYNEALARVSALGLNVDAGCQALCPD
jgi:hypothetical protein